MEVTIVQALFSLTPAAKWMLNGNSYSGLEWLDTVQTKPTEQEVNAEIARLNAEEPFTACKNTAKKLIAESDWAVLPDVGISNGSEFVAYRATLRELIKNPVANPVFPAVPQAVWI
jgi:hypothetical protein